MLTDSTESTPSAAPTGSPNPRVATNRPPYPQYVPIITSAPIQRAIRALPIVANEMLVDPNTHKWKHDTFLVDTQGHFRNQWRELHALVGNASPNKLLHQWTQLPAHGPNASTIAPFLNALLDEGEKQKKLLLPAAQLREYVTVSPGAPVLLSAPQR